MCIRDRSKEDEGSPRDEPSESGTSSTRESEADESCPGTPEVAPPVAAQAELDPPKSDGESGPESTEPISESEPPQRPATELPHDQPEPPESGSAPKPVKAEDSD